MSHITRNKTKLLSRVRRMPGQVEALERALEAEKGCSVPVPLPLAHSGRREWN